MLLGRLKLVEQLHGQDCSVKGAKRQVHLRLGDQICKVLLEQVVEGVADIIGREFLLILTEREVDLTHLQCVGHLLTKKFIGKICDNAELGVRRLIV